MSSTVGESEEEKGILERGSAGHRQHGSSAKGRAQRHRGGRAKCLRVLVNTKLLQGCHVEIQLDRGIIRNKPERSKNNGVIFGTKNVDAAADAIA
eukprot:7455891-Pyramimonas_sp.AAC.1